LNCELGLKILDDFTNIICCAVSVKRITNNIKKRDPKYHAV